MSVRDEKKDELIQLVSYMVRHNASHNNELSELAQQIRTQGYEPAFEKSMKAVEFFAQGNSLLEEVLKEIEV